MKIQSEHKCLECDGCGEYAVINAQGDVVRLTECYHCGGLGLRDGFDECPSCQGNGCHVCDGHGYTEEMGWSEYHRLSTQSAKYLATPKIGAV